MVKSFKFIIYVVNCVQEILASLYNSNGRALAKCVTNKTVKGEKKNGFSEICTIASGK